MEANSIVELQSLWFDSGLDDNRPPPMADLSRANGTGFLYYVIPSEHASRKDAYRLARLCKDNPRFFRYIPRHAPCRRAWAKISPKVFSLLARAQPSSWNITSDDLLCLAASVGMVAASVAVSVLTHKTCERMRTFGEWLHRLAETIDSLPRPGKIDEGSLSQSNDNDDWAFFTFRLMDFSD